MTIKCNFGVWHEFEMLCVCARTNRNYDYLLHRQLDSGCACERASARRRRKHIELNDENVPGCYES